MANYDKWIDNIGEVVLSDTECSWVIPRHMFLNKRLCISSPWFSHEGETWRFAKTPKEGDNNYVCMYLWKKIPRKLPKYIFKMYLKSYCQSDIIASYTGNVSDFGDVCYEFFNLQDSVQAVSSCGLVALFFELHIKNVYYEGGKLSQYIQFIREIGTPGEENNQCHKNEDIARSMECKESSDEDKENSDEDEASTHGDKTSNGAENNQKKRSDDKGIKKLSENLKQVLLDERMTDVILKVENREFKVHKIILVARSPVFASMFEHDMTEKKDNAVDIPDCTAESFEVFLHYLYCGKIKTLSANNMSNVYYAADKYHVDDLKEKCVKFMIKNMSAETFCDVIALSLRHAEVKLRKIATDFFCQNIKKIVKTVQWQKYLQENSIQANELLIKALNA